VADLATIHPLAKCCWCGSPFVLGTVKGAAVWLCPTEACWKKQVARAMAVTLKGKGEVVRFVPLPRQVEAEQATFEGPAIYVLIGGAAGGSKSRGLREIGHKAALKTPQTRVLLLRRTYKELDQTHLRDVEMEAPQMGADAVPSAKVVRYPNGSVMQFGHCETAADAANYLSAEYDLIIFDELVTFEETMFLLIASRARSTKPGVVPKVIAGTNPGGPQSHWVRARFIDHTVDLDQYPDYDPAEWVFIPSKLEDNPYLDQAYERKLLALPPELRKAYRDGDWDIFPGQYFPEWRKKSHVWHALNLETGQREPTHPQFPSDLERVLSLDWGFVKPGVCGFWALHDGHAVREDEYVFTRTTAFRVGEEIARRIKTRGLTRIKYLVYDTAMEIPDNDSGESTISTVKRGMKAGGVSIATVQADKDRVNGWQRLRHWFGLAPDGKPWMLSSPLCTYFNRTIPSLVSAETKPEDVDTHGEDHAADESRYFAMSMPVPGAVTKKEPVKEWTLAWLKNQSQRPAGILAGRTRVA
jgi:phage terminase large subunit